MKVCLNCGRGNKTNRLICVECRARAQGVKAKSRSSSAAQANGLTAKVLDWLTAFKSKAALAPPLVEGGSEPAQGRPMEQLRRWFKQHQPDTAGLPNSADALKQANSLSLRAAYTNLGEVSPKRAMREA